MIQEYRIENTELILNIILRLLPNKKDIYNIHLYYLCYYWTLDNITLSLVTESSKEVFRMTRYHGLSFFTTVYYSSPVTLSVQH